MVEHAVLARRIEVRVLEAEHMPYEGSLKQREYQKAYRQKKKLEISLQKKEYRLKVKIKVLTYYSKGKPFCECCKEDIIEFLSIDHINGGGTKHRKQISNIIYWWLIKNNYPEGYRVLCHNCNQAFGFYGKCPHATL